MPAEVINWVHELAEAQDIDPDLSFGNRGNRIIQQAYPADDDKNSTYVTEVEDGESLHYDDELDPPSDEASSDSSNENNNADTHDGNGLNDHAIIDNKPSLAAEGEDEEPLFTGVEDDEQPAELNVEDHAAPKPQPIEGENPGVENQQDNQPLENPGMQKDPVIDKVTTAMDNAYGPRTSSYNLCRQRRPDYRCFGDVYLGANMVDEPIPTPQVSMKRGVEMFGAKGVVAVKKEIQQLHD